MSEDGPPDVIGVDDSAFDDFVAGWSARLFSTARLLTGGHRAEAEDLLQGAYERAYRRWGRIAAACVAVLAVGVAGTLVTRGVLAAGPAGRGPGGTGPVSTGPVSTGPAVTGPAAVPSGPATGAPGTMLRDCESNNFGTLGSDWKARSMHAGPVWFIYARPATSSPSQPRAAGKTRASAMIIAVRNGRTAVVTAAPSLGGRFRFLAGFNNSGTPYTLSEGAPGLRLVGCPPSLAGPHLPASDAPGLTMFWEGFVTDLRGCIPLEVRASPGSHPVRVTVAGPGGGCGS
jgi:hypothetical protein